MALSTPDWFAGIPAHRARRARLFDELGDGLLILATSPVQMRNSDVDFPFRADSDFVYLTGFPEPEAVLVAWRKGSKSGERLYVRPKDKKREIWDGPRYGVPGARKVFGFEDVRESTKLRGDLAELVATCALGAATGSFDVPVHHTLGRDEAFDRQLLAACRGAAFARRREGPPAHPPIVDPRPALARMRLIKDAHELAMLRRAGRLTAAAHREAMRFARAGRTEFEVQAAVEHVFRGDGSKRNGYESIVASGPNACVLHYVENDRKMRRGDLLLIDAGAEVGYYTADITRTFPVDGTFSKAQRAVYAVVLRAQQAAIRAVQPGRPVDSVHTTAVRELTRGLVELGILRSTAKKKGAEVVKKFVEEKAYAPYYMHGTSHWLGLDVHDAGAYKEPSGKSLRFQPGMVLTVEPGLYFGPRDRSVPKEFRGIGIRIEDDVAVADGRSAEVLTADAPREIADVETACSVGVEAAAG